MAMDGKLLYKAREALRLEKEQNEAEYDRRYAEVYAKIPTMLTMERQLRKLISQTVAVALKADRNPEGTLQRVESESAELLKERGEILEANGYPADYLDGVYSCKTCRDSGYTDTGAMCACLKKGYERERAKELSALNTLGADSFLDFHLEYYDDKTPDARIGTTPRQCMEIVLSRSRKYALNFGKDSPNLLLRGGAGLGKTLICACIAKAVSAKGGSVFYDTASSIFTVFETHRFSRDALQAELAAEKTRKILSCDLLVLDDLGTEMTNALAHTALYTIINTRLTANKKTIIVTGLSSSETATRYTPQIVSRLEGEFQALLFIGKDIRQKKQTENFTNLQNTTKPPKI